MEYNFKPTGLITAWFFPAYKIFPNLKFSKIKIC